MSDNAQLLSAASTMFDILLSVREFLADQFDTVDNECGQPRPNEAMRLAQEIDDAIALVRGASK